MRPSGSDNAPAGLVFRVEIVCVVGDHHTRVGGSDDSGDRCGQSGADDDSAFVHQMIDRADRRKRVQGEDLLCRGCAVFQVKENPGRPAVG
jgi:hypothetical protein